MRRLVLATTLAAALAPAAALDASAASGLVMPRKYDLACEIKFTRGAYHIVARNTAGRTIPRGTRIDVVMTSKVNGRTVGTRTTIVAVVPVVAGNSARRLGGNAATSCSASVQLLPDVTHR